MILRYGVDRRHARHRRRAPRGRPGVAHEGRVASGLVVYTSEQAHSSIEKGAIAWASGRTTCARSGGRRVPHAGGRAGRRRSSATWPPACARAAWRPRWAPRPPPAWTPCRQIADICERHGIWLHVDAAYAGSPMVAPEFRWAFAGCERADSLVTNPHKWLLTPMDCSVFYTRRPDVLRRAFSLVPEYLQTRRGPARRQPDGLRRAARPALPRVEAVVRHALLRPRRVGRGIARARAPGAGIRPRRGSRPALRAHRARRLSRWCASATRARTTTTAASRTT